jgi:signal transduction histidine kinase
MAQPIRVLVIDDNDLHYQLIEDILAESNLAQYEVEWADHYELALERVVKHEYDVCLLDYDLGRRSGLDFIKEPAIQKRNIPIIFLTGRGSAEIDFKAMRGGVVDYLDKTHLQADHLERAIRYAAERAKTLRGEHNQRTFLEALLSVIGVLSSTLEFDEVVARILENIGKVIPHDVVDFMLVEDGYTRVVQCSAHGNDFLENVVKQTRFAIADTTTFRTMQHTRAPLLIADISEFADWIVEPKQPVQSYLGVPIFNAKQLLGFINLTSYHPYFFTPEHSERLRVFAQQAAIAIQNAQQYQHAQEIAAEQERNRLARDLHDSVTQTLFSASVIAETLPRLIEIDIEETRRGLVKLATLSKGALAEMRTLLVELRPTFLTEISLDTLLAQLVTGMAGRSNAAIDMTINGKPRSLPPDVQITLYRIAQESLNNIVKHAHAQQVHFALEYAAQSVSLTVTDDGSGFDVNTLARDGMGIRFMQERAAKVAIDLDIRSAAQQGTTVTARWQS